MLDKRRFVVARLLTRITLVFIFTLVAFSVFFSIDRPRPMESLFSAIVTCLVCLAIAAAIWWV